MTSLLTYTALIYYIEFYVQYIMCLFCETYNKDNSKVITGSGAVRKVTKERVFHDVVQLRNAIIHYDVSAIESYIDLLSNVDTSEGYLHVNDLLALEGLDLIVNSDLQGLKNYLLST